MKTLRPESRKRHPGTLPRRREPRSPKREQRHVLVPTDGSKAAAAALTLARWMEQRGEWAPEALTILEPVPVSVADIALPMPMDYQQMVGDSVLARMAEQVRTHGSRDWKLDVEFGRVAPTIVRVARERGVSLITLGLGRHGKLARIFGAETAARVARLSEVPVLAVDAGVTGAPRTAVVAIDFGRSSVRAAREALRLLERPARLHLLHVRWAIDGNTMRDADWERTYADGVDVSFARLIDELGPQPGVRITSEMGLGSVTETVLATAKKLKAHLIAAGSHNQDLMDRILIGSTPANLLRAAPCSVLVAPPEQ